MKDYKNLVRVGVVSATKQDELMVRVHFPQFDNLVSGWLKVLQHPAQYSVSLHESHNHTVTYRYWMPKVNDMVLVVYTPGFSMDGYVLGVIP